MDLHDAMPGSKHNRRLQGSVAQHLGIQILTGQIAVGHQFPGEIEFSEQLGISRSALREAFRVLGAKGLIEGRPKAGTKVTPRQRWNLLDPDLLAWQFETEPSARFVRDLFELRMVVEPAAAALAAKRRSDDQVGQMSEALDTMARHGLASETGRAADQRFHVIMLEATGNEAFASLATSIMAAIAWTTIFKQRRQDNPRDPMPEHRALLAAIEAKNASRARRAMAELVRLALNDTKTSLRAPR